MAPENPADVLRHAIDSGFDPVKLRALREARLAEMDRIGSPNISNVNGGSGSSLPYVVSGATHADRHRLMDEIANDPYTGNAEQDRTARTRATLDAAATTMRPEVADAAKSTAERNAFAEFLKAQGVEGGKLTADVSPAGADALDAASRRKIAENESGFTSRLNLASALADSASQRKGLSAEGTKSATALHQAVDLGQKLRTILTDQLHANPAAARESGILGQAKDMAIAPFKRWLYSKGALQAPLGYDESTQLADWMKVLATRGLMGGVRNMEWISQIQDHLAAGKLPPAASLQRLEQFLAQAPDLETDIYEVEKNHERLPPNPAQVGLITDPNWGASR